MAEIRGGDQNFCTVATSALAWNSSVAIGHRQANKAHHINHFTAYIASSRHSELSCTVKVQAEDENKIKVPSLFVCNIDKSHHEYKSLASL